VSGPASDNPNVTMGEQAALLETGIEVQLSDELAALRDRIVEAFGDISFGVSGFRGELTLELPADRIVDVLRFCRDDADVACELLADLSAVHWPGGKLESGAEETTGWPTYTEERAGRIEIDYVLYSVANAHRFRLRTSVDDVEPGIASATSLYRSANFMEREVFDFFGVRFDGHPDLRRIEMPDEWEGHPHRKDYPLGGVEVEYKGGATIPPPDERSY
jgi:NADH-quinone oxidoreductase subunit C